MNQHIKFLFLSFAFLFFFQNINAQVYDQRGQGIYLEMLGSTGFVSLNYEIRFPATTEGLGVRVGITGINNSVIFPVIINYLIGKKDKSRFLELGVGALFSTNDYPFVVDAPNERQFENKPIPLFVVGFRYHPRYNGFLFRAGMTPQVGRLLPTADKPAKTFFRPLFGISLGKAF